MAETPKRTKRTAKRTTARKKATKRAAKKPGQRLLRVKQVRSGIGHARTYRRTLRALGIQHHQQVITVPDTPSVRGALHKVRHLVEVTPAEET